MEGGYPAWVYGPKGERKIIRSEAEFQSLGPAWSDRQQLPEPKPPVSDEPVPAVKAAKTK